MLRCKIKLVSTKGLELGPICWSALSKWTWEGTCGIWRSQSVSIFPLPLKPIPLSQRRHLNQYILSLSRTHQRRCRLPRFHGRKILLPSQSNIQPLQCHYNKHLNRLLRNEAPRTVRQPATKRAIAPTPDKRLISEKAFRVKASGIQSVNGDIGVQFPRGADNASARMESFTAKDDGLDDNTDGGCCVAESEAFV